jgi:class 3 adenylate cyclase
MVAGGLEGGRMTEVDLEALLDDIDSDVASELASKPEVVDKGHDLDLDSLPIEVRKWHKLTDAVAVVADLKNSTQLGLNKHAASTASIYEASTGGVVQILDEFDADFVAIQGDGAFALFWGDRRRERGICAGITIKTFSYKHLVPRLGKKWPELPETGLKVGIANSPLLVKRVGVPRTSHQEPVWAGRAVNYAAKAAQQADRHEMIVTGAIWDWASENDYLAVSCPCNGPSPSIWHDVTIEKIPDSDGDRQGKRLTSYWCDVHGPEYCTAILDGKKQRSDATAVRISAVRAEMSRVIRSRAARQRRDRVARTTGFRYR